MFSLKMHRRDHSTRGVVVSTVGAVAAEDVNDPDPSIYDVHPTLPASVSGDSHEVGATAVEEVKSTTSDTIKILGWGLFIWVGFRYILPTFFGATTHTRRAAHELSSVGREERERRQERAEMLNRDRREWNRAHAEEVHRMNREAREASYDGGGDRPINIGHIEARPAKPAPWLLGGPQTTVTGTFPSR